ncbi:hypothetical protein VPH35_001392 [Triticum aestivum]|uniref:uncharacterized protein isoform X2 n=1 Tax=Triticum aestivum TaxID=4565 RepID=UPI001D024862|nr:uncharacterized protein LOC123039319 isoform X2 [Triticum aestivum]
MENEGDGWSSRGSDPGPAGPGDADSEVGGGVASEEREVRKRRRKKGGEGRSSPETGDGGRTAAGDGGIQSRPFGRHQSGHGWSTNEDLTTRHTKMTTSRRFRTPDRLTAQKQRYPMRGHDAQQRRSNKA